MNKRQENSTPSLKLKFDDIMSVHQAGELTREQTAALYRKFLAFDDYRPRALHRLALLELENNRCLEAVGLLSQAVALVPTKSEYHHNLATVLRILGNFEDAEYHYTCALKLKPDYAEAYFNFADTRRFTADDDIVKLLEIQLQTVNERSDGDRCFLHFAAGKVYQDIKDYPRAFAHFRQGNEARNAVFDWQVHNARVEELMAVCSRALFEAKLGQGHPTASPIFIVGMPRSGTTLTESILTRHSRVTGLGELPDIRSIAYTLPNHTQGIPYPKCLKEAGPEMLEGFANAYLKRVSQLAPKGSRTVDKLTGNIFHLGLIALMFPKAKIIHCHRHPLDTCLSCYCKKFSHGQEFSFDLENLGHYYLAYKRVMQHWHTVLPIPIFDLEYEQLIQSQEQTSRALLDFCDLPWEEACLSFNQQNRAVRTASNWQVRQPLYASSVHRWKRYEQELALCGPF